jgi:hypothetical protein
MRNIYFTAFSPDYYQDAKLLQESGKKFNIDVEIVEVPSQNTREDFLYKKPQLILYQLLKYKQPVVWLDSDMRIEAFPEALEEIEDYDFGVLCWKYISFQKLSGIYTMRSVRNDCDSMNNVLCSGGLYIFNYTEEAIKFLKKWISTCELPRVENEGDDMRFDITYNKLTDQERSRIKFITIPASYNRMVTHFPRIQPVINHLMVSVKGRK